MTSRNCCASDPDVKEKLEAMLVEDLNQLPPEEKMEKISEILHSLSHPLRLKIAYLLLKNDYCVCDIVKLTGKAPNLVSHHLAVMRHGGIITPFMKSGYKYYKLHDRGRKIIESIN